MTANLKSDYAKQGFLSPITVLSAADALRHRGRMEEAEAQFGPVHYLAKMHTILRSPFELATHPGILNVVETLLGPDLLLYNSTYIIKEARAPAHVSWHQDLTYWGLDGDAQVSVWLALSRADAKSGCMRMIPGSHARGALAHDLSRTDENNVLYQSQTVRDVDESGAVYCALAPGQASFHHGWTLHSSLPNHSDDRRIGLNLQYIAPHVRQVKLPGYTALLVRGEDRFGHYAAETPAQRDLEPAAMAWRREQEELHMRIAGNA
ncbi:MAG: phytanoyl-CoA dioxygenase family protein [Gammaproteobacteria bacterium]